MEEAAPEEAVVYDPAKPILGLANLEALRAAADENGVIRLYKTGDESC